MKQCASWSHRCIGTGLRGFCGQDIRTLYDQGQALVQKKGDPVMRDWKKLESARGFLVYVAQTYTTMLPYLKDVHLTIDSWWANQNAEGWWIKEDSGPLLEEEPETAPSHVKVVPRLIRDLEALEELTVVEEPPEIRVHPVATASVAFMYEDTLGARFGQSLWLLGAEEVDVFHGLWDQKAVGKLSN